MSDRPPSAPIRDRNLPFDPDRPFRRRAAFANGITKKQLDGRRFRRLSRGVYVSSHVPITYDVRIAAVAEAAHYGTFSHLTAAYLLGAPTPRHSDVHLMIHRDMRRTITGAHVHRRMRTPHWTYARGFAVTDPIDTMRDLAEMDLDLVDLVAVGDGLVHAGHLTAAQLLHRLRAPEELWDKVVERAVEAAELVRDRVESAMETRLRLILVSGGLQEPVVNFPITDPSGHVRRRIDLAYPDLKVAIEYDGRHHIEREEQWRSDIRRREELEREGWAFVIVTAKDLSKPQEIVRRVAEVCASPNRS